MQCTCNPWSPWAMSMLFSVLRVVQKLKNSYLFFPLGPDKGQNQYIKGEFSPVE